MKSEIQKLTKYYLWLIVLTIFLQLMGAATRATGAGLSCPDWPLCMGEVIPSLSHGIFYEFGHRVLAGAVAVGLLFAVIIGWRSRECRARLGAMPAICTILLFCQIGMGGVTVLMRNAGWTVTIHLLLANIFCASLLIAARKLGSPKTVAPARLKSKRLIVVGALLLIAQIAIGGLVAGYHAGLACIVWPECIPGVFFPTFEGLIGLHLLHRGAGYLLVTVSLWIWIDSRPEDRNHKSAQLIGVASLAQLLLGVVNVALIVPPWVTTLHTLGASALVLLYTSSMYALFSEKNQ
jgi:cytochrome c oxidase assembly protein subunit 15